MNILGTIWIENKKKKYMEKSSTKRKSSTLLLKKMSWYDLIWTYFIVINCYEWIEHKLYKLNLPTPKMYNNKFNKVFLILYDNI